MYLSAELSIGISRFCTCSDKNGRVLMNVSARRRKTRHLLPRTLINKLIRKYSTELGLKGSWTSYNKYGKGVKRRLRFSKSGDKNIEDRYATHYIDTKRINELYTFFHALTLISAENN